MQSRARLSLTLFFFVAAAVSAGANFNAANAVPSSVFDVTHYGAVGDGAADDTVPIAAALRAASTAAVAGAPVTVLFPASKVFLTGPLNMTSNMTLSVEGTLRAKSGNNSAAGISGWPQIPPLPNYGDSRDGPYLQFQAFVYAVNATNIAIKGNGTIDGQGDWWWFNHQRNRSVLPSGRPNLVQLVGCQSVHVHVHHIKIRSRMYAPNSDGIDPDSSRNVLIEHNDVSCGDDHIAIKAGVCGTSSPNSCLDPRFQDGTFETRNITVRFNTFRIGMGISVGSESSGGILDVFIHDNVIGLCDAGHCLDTCCGWGPALHLKTALTRGNTMANIVFANNTIYNNSQFIDVETNYQSGDTPPVGYPATRVENISFVGNKALGSATGAEFVCSVHDVCENIVVRDNVIANAANPWSCKFIHTFDVAGNSPAGLEECMHNSMNRSRA